MIVGVVVVARVVIVAWTARSLYRQHKQIEAMRASFEKLGQ